MIIRQFFKRKFFSHYPTIHHFAFIIFVFFLSVVFCSIFASSNFAVSFVSFPSSMPIIPSRWIRQWLRVRNIHICFPNSLPAPLCTYSLLRKRETEIFARGKTTVRLVRKADQLGWEYWHVLAVMHRRAQNFTKIVTKVF